MMVNREGDNPKVLKWALIRFTISLAAAVIAVGLYAVATKDEAKEGKQKAQAAVVTSRELTDAIVKNCEENGNPLREVLQNQLHREIRQNQNTELLEHLFSEADPEELRQLIAKQVKIAKHELKLIAPLNCKNQYPAKKGAK